jgi:hypothetical protein
VTPTCVNTAGACSSTTQCCSGLICNAYYAACYTCGVTSWGCLSDADCCTGTYTCNLTTHQCQ